MAPPFSSVLPFIYSIFARLTPLIPSLTLNILDSPSASKMVPSVPIILIGLSITI